ncbi:RNA polymerase sigma factor [Microlunatus soli]|uniref:RNA polymerase sigma-70 factor, ECF subfamily n=1 Tax=Microlunatus soli TaxID=630515 RepID=A0A1H1YZ02_9ACTN|nr:sigma-70 family RNA polymerase sigma factor [Microlunatus soli]SDT26765.1 RNA polymerase sigma-70 factor, ECF subfamily [Microlunatus soli]
MIERLLREEWGRLLALLVARYRRLDLAEDGLADAFEAAARTWSSGGEPDNPAAWLLTTARRRITDRLRSEAVLVRRLPLLVVDAELAASAQRVMADPGDELLDERLRLVLLCAHPRLTREAAAALTLRLVLGVSTADIARLFLLPQATMAARLTRARRKLAGADFTLPAAAELSGRVGVAADVAYLAFTAGYAPGSGPDVLRSDSAGEAIRLVRVLRSLIPAADTELDALLALMLLQHSRRAARVRDGELVLLADQDRNLWRYDEITEALAILEPLTDAAPGRHLVQALIAAEHAIAPSAADTAWDRIVQRYDELLDLADSPIVRLNRAVAIAELAGPDAGLVALQDAALPHHRLPATRAELLARAGRADEALQSFDIAITLCGNASERSHLLRRRARVAAAR